MKKIRVSDEHTGSFLIRITKMVIDSAETFLYEQVIREFVFSDIKKAFEIVGSVTSL